MQGPRNTKTNTVAKAVRFAREHREHFPDLEEGAFLIDLNRKEDMKQIYQELISKFNMKGAELNLQSIIARAELNKKKLLVFEDIDEGNETLVKEFLAFLIRLY